MKLARVTLASAVFAATILGGCGVRVTLGILPGAAGEPDSGADRADANTVVSALDAGNNDTDGASSVGTGLGDSEVDAGTSGGTADAAADAGL